MLQCIRGAFLSQIFLNLIFQDIQIYYIDYN